MSICVCMYVLLATMAKKAMVLVVFVQLKRLIPFFFFSTAVAERRQSFLLHLYFCVCL